ncbi:DUF4302 domain-containing protein [Agriterribacter sp.]|uniref:DUF4302 domain-containing protein n=1 Tax=Agriterribacter sp. TaxID=2821509 RepID=UPI002C7F271C|nr:DUF4302 domain-containing protein [Agriterribacter sp.]HRO46801.1 DUF4302 domain-containing protein [Agriterribacter sp.]HRQ15590.1 DUF4302 domain-containing protein [Agriterribacter sp.]
MKKIALYILSITLCLTACRKDEPVFDQSPDERINKTLNDYQSALVSSPTGWKATVIPGSGGIYHFYFRFNNENRVFMFSDFDTITSKYQKESSYRLKALQQPTLIFDTYSYLHLLSDPDATVNGGAYGSGLISDFEFSLDTLYADSIILTGKMNNTKLRLEKASQQELNEWQNGEWANAVSFTNVTKIKNYFKRLTLSGVEYEIFVDPASRTTTLQWLSGGTIKQFSTAYYFNVGGVVFETPLINGSQIINEFTDVFWNEASQSVNLRSGNSTGIIAGAIKPLKTDVSAPQRWWQTAVNDEAYWESYAGFHVNGVDDAFGINTLGRFYSLIYWPEYDTGNDLFAPAFVNAAGTGLELQYGAAPDTPEFTADGRAVFSLLGLYGSYPASGPAAQTLAKLLIPQGYYFIQTSSTTYDMVSADDAKTWITWNY